MYGKGSTTQLSFYRAQSKSSLNFDMIYWIGRNQVGPFNGAVVLCSSGSILSLGPDVNRDALHLFAPVGNTAPKIEAIESQAETCYENGKEEDKKQQTRKYPEQNSQQHQDNPQDKGQKEPTSRYSPVHLIGHDKSPLHERLLAG